MVVITNWVFWAIIAAIILVMAIIGYLVESSELNKKRVIEEEKPEETKEQENLLWSENAPKEDERQETIHTVEQADDWTTIPTVASGTANQTLSEEVTTPIVAKSEPNIIDKTPDISEAKVIKTPEPLAQTSVIAPVEEISPAVKEAIPEVPTAQQEIKPANPQPLPAPEPAPMPRPIPTSPTPPTPQPSPISTPNTVQTPIAEKMVQDNNVWQ